VYGSDEEIVAGRRDLPGLLRCIERRAVTRYSRVGF
jgi:hypothetical protein